ncbi:MAG: argininosuccinate lyase [Bacteroidota bacterium]|nr:argininosuccinate lyase [Bacteroidota bacterium]
MAKGDLSQRMWGGRLEGETDTFVAKFGASVDVDQRMAMEDIQGSIAHAEMLKTCGILTGAESAEIINGLKDIREDIRAGRFVWRTELEDVHMNIEHALIQRIGLVGGKLHTARSRNDQVATDLRLWLRSATRHIMGELVALRRVLVDLAEKHLQVIMPGYTHLQVAQPVRFSHHLMAYCAMLERDSERFGQTLGRLNRSPLGAGALAGTGFPIDPEQTARQLGFDEVAANSMDAVSDRDFALEFLSCCSIVMVHLSRLCEELILWSGQEFGFVTLPDSHTTGSSIMPQKKNADMCELIRGKTGRVCGALTGLLITMKGLPLAYNKDMQEDKEGIFDAADTVRDSLKIMRTQLPGITVHAGRMRAAASQAFSNATDLADYLANRGMPFRDAHELVGHLVMMCLREGKVLEELSLIRLQEASPLIGADVYTVLRLDAVVDARDSLGGTSELQVQAAIERARRSLSDHSD